MLTPRIYPPVAATLLVIKVMRLAISSSSGKMAKHIVLWEPVWRRRVQSTGLALPAEHAANGLARR